MTHKWGFSELNVHCILDVVVFHRQIQEFTAVQERRISCSNNPCIFQSSNNFTILRRRIFTFAHHTRLKLDVILFVLLTRNT